MLTVNYFTIGSDHAKSVQPWRQFFLRQYFGLPTELTANRLLDWGFWLNPSNFSKIALYGDLTKTYIASDYRAPVDIIASQSGWFDGGDVPTDPSNKFGITAVEAHNASTDTKLYDRNLGYWETLIPFLQRKKINIAIVLLPTDISCYSKLNKAKVALMNNKLSAFANKHHIKFIDYTGDPRFSANDFTWEMPDHMNAQGAMKFSKILDKDVVVAK